MFPYFIAVLLYLLSYFIIYEIKVNLSQKVKLTDASLLRKMREQCYVNGLGHGQWR